MTAYNDLEFSLPSVTRAGLLLGIGGSGLCYGEVRPSNGDHEHLSNIFWDAPSMRRSAQMAGEAQRMINEGRANGSTPIPQPRSSQTSVSSKAVKSSTLARAASARV